MSMLRRRDVFIKKFQGGGIQAIAPMRRRRSIVEYMTQMTVAALAADLNAVHAMAPVLKVADVGVVEGLVKAWPTRAGFELVVGLEQRQPAQPACVDAHLFIVQ